MATWKYWKDENYVREYEYGKMEDLYQSLKKHGISDSIRTKIMKSGEQIKKTSKKEAVAEWFFSAMNVMDELLDVEFITSALMSMGKKSFRFVLTELGQI